MTNKDFVKNLKKQKTRHVVGLFLQTRCAMNNEMQEDKYFPKVIRIMPHYGPCYASDEEGCVFDVTSIFENHQNIIEIQDIENEFYGLAMWIDSGDADNNPNFPWQEFNDKGLELSKRLAVLLQGCGLPIIYRAQLPGNQPPEEILVCEE